MTARQMRPLIAEIARSQHGVVTRPQLTSVGFNPSMIRDRVRAHELSMVAPQTFVLAGAPPSGSQRHAIAVLSRNRAFLSGRSAAFVHSFDGVALPSLPEITVPATASGRSPVASVRRSQHFANIATAVVDGIMTADVSETIFRMAQYVSPRRLARFLDAALLSEPESSLELGEIYLRHQGERMKGMSVLRPLLRDRLGDGYVPTESELEAMADTAFAELPVPSMLRQAPIPWAPTSGRVDRFVPEWRLIIELDGRRWHARTEAFESDRARDNAAVANGYSVLRFTWRMLQSNPEHCRQQILRVGAQRDDPGASVVLSPRNSALESTTDAGEFRRTA